MDRLRNFGFLVKDVSRLHTKNFERHSLGLNMTLAQCKVLSHLERNEGISQVRLAELTDTDPMTLVRILDRMERDGWIERRADPSDRRARRLFLKGAAAPVLQEMWRIADRARAEALTGLSAADREQLVNLLSRIQTNLNSLLPDAESDVPAIAAKTVATKQPGERPAATSRSQRPVASKRLGRNRSSKVAS